MMMNIQSLRNAFKNVLLDTPVEPRTYRVPKSTSDAKGLRSGGKAVERRTVNRGDGGSITPVAVSKLRQFCNPTFACVFR